MLCGLLRETLSAQSTSRSSEKKRKRTYRKQPKGYEFPRKYDIVNYLNSMDT